MSHIFFTPTANDKIPEKNNLKRFLENFPEQELWRFFVEKYRYNTSSKLYRQIYAELTTESEEEVAEIPIETIQAKVKGLISSQGKKKSKKLMDSLHYSQGWVNCKVNEPGYFAGVTRGFIFILESVVNNKPFNLEFIKNLNKICTKKVGNMLTQHTPGQFRELSARWKMSKIGDSLNGLIETIDYLKSVEEMMSGYSGFSIYCYNDNGEIDSVDKFTNESSRVLAESIYDNFKDGVEMFFSATKSEAINTEKFLKTVCNKNIEELEKQLKTAKTKEEKLAAIFTYLKHDVLAIRKWLK